MPAYSGELVRFPCDKPDMGENGDEGGHQSDSDKHDDFFVPS